jgi:hypothetical protein
MDDENENNTGYPNEKKNNYDFDSYFGDDSTDAYADQNSFENIYGDDSNDAAIPITYDPADQSHAETERLLRQSAADPADNDLINQAKNNPSLWGFLSKAVSTLGTGALNYAKQAIMTNGKVDFAKIVTGMAAIKALTGGDKPKSNAYQGKIPTYTATRAQVPYDYVNEKREPGSYGRDYFSDINYSAPDKAGEASTAGVAEAQAMKTQNDAVQAAVAAKQARQEQEQENQQFAMPWQSHQKFAKGGRYLDGQTDGMADKIPSTIDGHQKAALSHGEFVIPADVVSHLGNGNSNAGAQKLYDMMARVRKARTGNQHQGKRINPDKFLGGGVASGYADGGNIQPDYYGPNGFGEINDKGEKTYADTGAVSTGTTGTGTGTTSSTTIPSQGSSVAEGLSTWAGPYVSEYLGKGQALANTPFQAYKGPLTAGASDLQKQQFGGLSNLAKTGFTPGQVNYQGFDANAAQQYMNPYTKAALDPQIAELNRQGQIQNVQNQYQARKQGGYGGSGAVLAQTENQRNTLDKVQSALGQGYNTAYNNAMAQFNADQSRRLQTDQANEANRQFSANYGLSNLQALGTAGATQRDITSQGIAADRAQFEEAKDFPYKQVQFQKSLLTGLPITTTENTQMQSQLSDIANKISGLATIYQTLEGLGQKKP